MADCSRGVMGDEMRAWRGGGGPGAGAAGDFNVWRGGVKSLGATGGVASCDVLSTLGGDNGRNVHVCMCMCMCAGAMCTCIVRVHFSAPALASCTPAR